VKYSLLVVVLALGWAAATGVFTIANLALGAVLAAVAALLIRDRLLTSGRLRRAGRLMSLMLLFIRELMVSATRVAVLVLRPDMKRHLQPGIIAFPLTATSDAEITVLANLITLTPGTLSVDVSEDRRFLFVHALSARNEAALVAEIRSGFETKVLGALR
jgi:multicomponent Na+:H+ antiporter subunit E